MSQNEQLELQELRLKLKHSTIESAKVALSGSVNVEQNSIKNKEYKIIAVRPGGERVADIKNDNLERLHKEREGLLATGMYTENDPLIMNIQKKIRNLS
jgi:hypothetical protein